MFFFKTVKFKNANIESIFNGMRAKQLEVALLLRPIVLIVFILFESFVNKSDSNFLCKK